LGNHNENYELLNIKTGGAMKRNYFLLFSGYCLLLAIILVGCGGGGPGSPGSSGSENTGVMVDASVVGSYNGVATNSVDAFPDQCGTPPATTPEFFADHQATVTFTARLLNPDATFQAGKLYIEKYTVELRRSTDSLGAPPIESDTRYNTIEIPAPIGASEVTVTTNIILVDLLRKDQYAVDMLSGRYSSGQAYLNNYTAIFTFYGQNQFGENFKIKTQMDFQIGNFNNC
jgi:hypothetical protein